MSDQGLTFEQLRALLPGRAQYLYEFPWRVTGGEVCYLCTALAEALAANAKLTRERNAAQSAADATLVCLEGAKWDTRRALQSCDEYKAEVERLRAELAKKEGKDEALQGSERGRDVLPRR